MPAKQAASKKRKRAGVNKRKAASRKAPASRKTTGKKRKVSKKKSATKKSSKKKSVTRKKAVAKKAAGKSAAKKGSRKKVTRKKASTKKAATRKAAAKTAATKKPAGKKKAKTKKTPVAKQPAGKKKAASVKKPSTKKAASKKTVVRKVPATNGKTPATRRRSRQELLSGPIHGIEPYSTKRGEEYMSQKQLAHFGAILSSWKRELMNEVDRTVHHMQDEAANFPDPNDRATQESEFGLELRTRDRERKLLRKIESALTRIDDGSYGYCDETGEEIGLKRLEARPVATLCLEAQERREMAERQFRDRDDRYR